MKCPLVRFLKVLLLTVLVSVPFNGAAFAAEGDEPVEIYFESQSGVQPDLLGTAFSGPAPFGCPRRRFV